MWTGGSPNNQLHPWSKRQLAVSRSNSLVGNYRIIFVNNVKVDVLMGYHRIVYASKFKYTISYHWTRLLRSQYPAMSDFAVPDLNAGLDSNV